MKKITFIVLTIVFGLISCEKEKIEVHEVKIINDPKFAQELKESPESIIIGNNTLFLTTYLWRDFMPIAEENGSKMMCVNKLTELNSIPISSTIELKKQYIIKGNEIWMAEYEIKKSFDFILEGFVRDGPKWGPYIEVDVVCEFENSGTTHRVLAKSQIIHKTE